MSRTSLVAGAPATTTATSISTDPEALARGDVVLLPIARLGTRYAALRPGCPRTSAELPAELPVRVAAMDDGRLEVIDGFKRLERWREQGRGIIPAIVECPGSVLELKRFVLAANAPPRTLTALDEAAVVRSLIAEDGLSVRAVAALLGRRPAWVTSRHKLATRLGAYPAELLARGKLRPTLAGLLATFPAKDQDALARAIERHGLSGREAAILLHAYRAADEADRRALLREPLARVRPAVGSALTRSPRAEALESRLLEIRRALLDLESFTFPGNLAPAEARRLEALHRSVVQQLGATAQTLGQSSTSKESIVERAQTEDPRISTEDAHREAFTSSTHEEGRAERQDIELELTTSRRRKRKRAEIKEEVRAEILELAQYYGARKIGARVGLSRKQVTRVLHEAGRTTPSLPPGQSKLDPFRERIAALVDKGLTATRILREIQAAGYTGRRTILAQYVARLRAELELSPRKQAKHRFETAPGEEIQIDWSPYMVVIAGRTLKIKAFGALLCASRKLFLRFYRDERQPTLLEAMASAFEYFKGCSLRVVLDNMATAVLSRGLGPNGQPLWHPGFLDFARHYGFTPFACAVRDPDRKGKKEKSFRLVWDDFLKGTEFGSWDELDARRRVWLDETPGVGNLRIHGTTRRVPNEAWLEEQSALIQLPEHRFPVYEKAARIVDRDATIWVRGTPYSVPSSLAERTVAVHLFAEHFEVLDPHGRVVFSRRYVPDAEKGRLVIDPTHYAGLKRRPRSTGGERIEDAFVKRFPDLVPLVEGLKLRLKALAPIHVRALVRLVDRYGEPAFLKAARRAQEYRRFDATAVERILERTEPLPEGDLIAPLHGLGPVALGEVEPPSLAHYEHLDAEAATETRDEEAKDAQEVNHGA